MNRNKTNITAACAALCLAACAAFTGRAGELITADVAILSGSTNAVADITLNRSGGWDAPAIDAFIAVNRGGATGAVEFAAADSGAIRAIGGALTVLGGASAVVYPVREFVAGGATNLAPWRARTIRVAVSQDTTNAAVYAIGIITR